MKKTKNKKQKKSGIFYVYLHNKTDCLDDTAIKVKAKNINEAVAVAIIHCRSNFYVGEAYSAKKFKSFDPDFYDMLRNTEAV